MSVRPARSDDLETIVEIERSAGEMFRSVGLVPDDDPGSVEELVPYQTGGRAFVGVDADDRPTGYILLDIVDNAVHIEQVTVHPDHARQRIGQSLIEHAARWATDRWLTALTLTTYVDVPWNAPYYERLGFRFLAEDSETPGLRVIRERERAAGLDEWPRTCMRRDLLPRSGSTLIRRPE
jgi:GNAT superfamily N-acetyltransferase